jgi:hypothetical protein
LVLGHEGRGHGSAECVFDNLAVFRRAEQNADGRRLMIAKLWLHGNCCNSVETIGRSRHVS